MSKQKSIKVTKDQLDRLWGDGGPYSEVHIDKDIRILDDKITRTFYYVYAYVNPTTFKLLKKNKNKIKDKTILVILETAEYRGPHFGYQCYFNGRIPEGREELLPEIEKQAVRTIIKMHKIVMELIK